MMKELNKLSIAFYWHLHQPVYQLEETFLMPYVRLHAVKDYLDMVLVLDRFPKLKLNFNIDPSLIDSILAYTEKGYKDVHQSLTLANIEELSEDEKAFILNNFFSAKYETMILKSERYTSLYKRRFKNQDLPINEFSPQDYSDLMALFNLAWIDPIHKDRYPEYRYLFEKQEGFTFEDRQQIINLNLQIMSEIIPSYKGFIECGRVEITTNPYYHPIVPILQDVKTTIKNVKTTEGLPSKFAMATDARKQIRLGLDRIEEVFGVRPKGFWPPELCLSNKTLSTLAEEGIKWTISDEAILSESIGFSFVRDFKGNLEDPYHLLKVYERSGDIPIDVVFRDRSLANLINFEYANLDPKLASRDLYDKIKSIQSKLLVSPDNNHLLTIALDGENCWERYENDGKDFLDIIYSEIESDPTIETVLISNYIEADPHKKELNKIIAGSWVNNSFQCWIGDLEKNFAWNAVKQVRDDLFTFKKEHRDISPEVFDKALKELYICQGSDWYWWYGEPNTSGQDYIFDYLFREHLKNAYKLLGMEPPEFLENSFLTTNDLSMRYPQELVTIDIDGLYSSESAWEKAGSIIIPDGPVYQENKLFDKIYFCNDSENLYLRIFTNKNNCAKHSKKINQFHIYTRNASTLLPSAGIRLINHNDSVAPLVREKFNNELVLTIVNSELFPIRFLNVTEDNCWNFASSNHIKIINSDVIDIKIPFEDLGVQTGDVLEFFFATSDNGIKDTFIPQDSLLALQRI